MNNFAKRQDDADVAERVLHWTGIVHKRGWPTDGCPPGCTETMPLPYYTTDVVADYCVLQHVRQTWSSSRLEWYARLLRECWRKRLAPSTAEPTCWEPHVVFQYHVGDYSNTALACLLSEKEST